MKSHRVFFSIVFSAIIIVASFIVLAVLLPRNLQKRGIDYLGIMVAILAVFATLLLAMQLYILGGFSKHMFEKDVILSLDLL